MGISEMLTEGPLGCEGLATLFSTVFVYNWADAGVLFIETQHGVWGWQVSIKVCSYHPSGNVFASLLFWGYC